MAIRGQESLASSVSNNNGWSKFTLISTESMIQSAHHHTFFISDFRMITKIGASCHNRFS
jgi:hypothetical protein